MNINPKKILVIQHKQIGDVILTTPVVKALKTRFPNARISFLTEHFCRPILEGNPYIENIIVFNKKKSNLFTQLKLYWAIRREKFDLVLDFFQNPRSALITAFSGAKVTVSYDHPTRGMFYKIKAPHKKGYVVDQKLSVLEAIGINGGDNHPEIYIPEKSQAYIDEYLHSIGIKNDDFLVCVDATHRRPTRKWTEKGYAQLIDMLCEKHNAKVVLLWGPGESDVVCEIKEMCKHNCFIACQTDLKQLAALIKRAHLHIGNDSAPRHIAASQGTPTLAILGSTGEDWTHPDKIHKTVCKHLPCQPCNNNFCKEDVKCMKELSAHEAHKAVMDFANVSDTLKHFLTREKGE